jgi:hypothetical protein
MELVILWWCLWFLIPIASLIAFLPVFYIFCSFPPDNFIDSLNRNTHVIGNFLLGQAHRLNKLFKL